MKLIVILFVTVLATIQVSAQESKKDSRIQLLKEDGLNQYKSDQINELDLLQALEFLEIRINKFNIGVFDKKYKVVMTNDEYLNGKIVKTDTLFYADNEYHYYETGYTNYFLDFFDQLKIITKTEENKVILKIQTYEFQTRAEFLFTKTDEKQFFNWRRYADVKWKLNEKIPLMVFASSWEDKEYGFHRFCGVVNLSKDDEKTIELLSNSPNYFVISYTVSELDN